MPPFNQIPLCKYSKLGGQYTKKGLKFLHLEVKEHGFAEQNIILCQECRVVGDSAGEGFITKPDDLILAVNGIPQVVI